MFDGLKTPSTMKSAPIGTLPQAAGPGAELTSRRTLAKLLDCGSPLPLSYSASIGGASVPASQIEICVLRMKAPSVFHEPWPCLPDCFCRKVTFRAVAILFIAVVAMGAEAANPVRISSPDNKIRCEVIVAEKGRLTYSVRFNEKPVIESSSMAIIVDNIDLSQGVEVGEVKTFQVNEKYPWRGVHSQAVDRCNAARIHITHTPSKTSYTVHVRAFNDGVAFRSIVPGDKSRVPDEGHDVHDPGGQHGLVSRSQWPLRSGA
jgi:hypothetical protein